MLLSLSYYIFWKYHTNLKLSWEKEKYTFLLIWCIYCLQNNLWVDFSFKCLNPEYQVWLCPHTSGKCFRCHKNLLLLWVCFLNMKCETFCRSGPQIHMALCHQTLTWGNSYWLQVEIKFERSLPFLSRVPWWEFITAVISWRTTQY